MIPVLQFIANRIAGIHPLEGPRMMNDFMRLYVNTALATVWSAADGKNVHSEKVREFARKQAAMRNSFREAMSFSSARSAEAARLDVPGLFERRSLSLPTPQRPVQPPDRLPKETAMIVMRKLSERHSRFDGREFVREVRRLVAEAFDGETPRFYREAGISRFTYSKIVSHPDIYRPDRDTVLNMARAFQLNLDGASNLLRLAGYALSPDRPQDRVWAVCFELGIYAKTDVDELLGVCNGNPF